MNDFHPEPASVTTSANDIVDFHGFRVPRWWADHIRAEVDAAPPLTQEQRHRLRALLRPVDAPAPRDP